MSLDLMDNLGAYEVPTYDEAFPPMASAPNEVPTRNGRASPPNQWHSKMSVRSSTVTQVFNVPVEERKFKEMSQQSFGEKGGEQAKICQDIMNRFGVHIEMSLARDQSLSVVVTGKLDKVMQARKQVVQQLQTQANTQIRIPREHHKFIIGPKGVKLGKLELKSATKISVPRPAENSDVISITGTREGIELARHEIQLISDEQAKLAFERLNIERRFHPFICGPHNKNVQELMSRTGAKIHVPPPSIDKDEIVVSGEKDGVAVAMQHILNIYNEKKRKCTSIAIEVRKSQHKYVIGPRGTGVSEILAETGVSVELPPVDSPAETITLRGEQERLGPALTLVYSKANSIVVKEVEAPSWLHRFIIGRKGEKINKIMEEYPKVHIEFTEGQNKIGIEGPPEEADCAKAVLEKMTAELKSKMAFAEIEIEQKYHRHIIGKGGANVNRIKGDSNLSIKIPSDTDPSNIIRLEGSPEGVALAKKELLEMVHKMENEKSRDILIEQRFHKTLIGAAGANIKEIRDRFNQVQITFPDAGHKSDKVTLRGPKNDVDKCYKYLQKLQTDLQTNNYQAQVKIFKQFHKNIIGKGGAKIRAIREETDTKIDLPSEAADSDEITITGKKENVEKARAKIEEIYKELANIKEIQIDIPHAFHNSIIGAKGRLIRSVMDECGGVIIRFPPSGSTSDRVTIRGPIDDVENARKQLIELSAQRKESSFVVELQAKPEYHKFLIGRGGVNIRRVRDQTGARVVFPTANDTEQETVVIMGRKDEVQKAKVELEKLIANLDKVVEDEVNIDSKHHRYFVARRGEILRQIGDDFGGVTVSFPRSGIKSDRVVIKGAKDCVEGAKKRLLEIVDDLDSQVTMDCVIPQKHHRTVMGAKGSKVQDITKQFAVNIKFPDKPEGAPNDRDKEKVAPIVNGEDATASDNGDDTPRKCDTIVITGKKDQCEGAKQALLDLVPVTNDVDIPFEFHRDIIGQKGRTIRQYMEEFDVNISVPPSDQQSDCVKVSGAPGNVQRAIEALGEKVQSLEGEKQERALKSYVLTVNVDPKHHPKIIGRRGAVITKIRTDYDVNIQFPDKGSDEITITGYQDKAEAAREAILKKVAELEDMLSVSVNIDHRVFPRLIGPKGRSIRKIMDDFKVDIRFPQDNSPNPDEVEISGAEDDVENCREHLLMLEEEYLQDINDRVMLQQYEKPSRGDEQSKPSKQAPFVVRGAPWDASAPDMSSASDFPELGAANSKSTPIRWGPPVKR